MEDNKDITEINLLHLLQTCSAIFPTGGFNHSFGLETFINKKQVKNAKDMIAILKVYLDTQFLFNDALGFKLLYKHFDEQDFDFIFELDTMFHVSTLPRETRLGYAKMGIRSIECLVSLFPNSTLLKKYSDAVFNKEAIGNAVVAYGIVFYELGISLNDAIIAFSYMSIANLIQNAVRAIPLGPSDGVKIGNAVKQSIIQLTSKVKPLDYLDFGVNGFELEIEQMNHETSLIRLFMS